jgi:hypothetical protein
MRMTLRCVKCFPAILVLMGMSSFPSAVTHTCRGGAYPQDSPNFGHLPLSFEVNQGQANATVKFAAKGPGYFISLAPTEAVLTFRGKPRAIQRRPDRSATNALGVQPRAAAVVRLKLMGANSRAQTIPLEPMAGTVNYFLGSDLRQWRTNIPTCARAKFQEVYPGVDWICYGNEGQLEYDFVVAAGADPNMIRLRLEGADRIEMDTAGDLILHTAIGEVREHRPQIYQSMNGRRHPVAGGYALLDTCEVGFQLGDYDKTKALVIDPILVYSSFFEGPQFDAGYAIALDAAGNAYITGETFSTPLGGGEAFVMKLDATGTNRVYFGYLGGSNEDKGLGIAVDAAGNACIVGRTDSPEFPITNAVQSVYQGKGDAFVAKINPAGNALIFSTFLGGSGPEIDAQPEGAGIALDSLGNIYVIGSTASIDFPVTPAAFQKKLNIPVGTTLIHPDVFTAKLSPAGELLYSSYLGGVGEDVGYGIAVDTAGSAYLTGYTLGDFPLANALKPTINPVGREAFVTKLSPDGAVSAAVTRRRPSGENWASLIMRLSGCACPMGLV